MNTRLSRWLQGSLVAMLLAASVVLGGCSWNNSNETAVNNPPTPTVIKIGHTTIPQSVMVAEAKGFFDEAGLDVQLQKFSNANLAMEALAHKDVDGTGTIAYTTLLAFENKTPGLFKVYDGFVEKEDSAWSMLLVKKGSNIKTAADLKGKKIVMRTGLSSKSQCELVIKGLGLDPKDVEFVQVEGSVLVQSFGDPSVSAFLDIQPFATVILEKGLGEIFEVSPRPKHILNPYPLAGATLSNDFIKANPEAVKKYVAAVEKAIDFVESNKPEARVIFKNALQLEENVANKMGLPEFVKANEIDFVGINKLADIEMSYKALDKKPDISGWRLQ